MPGDDGGLLNDNEYFAAEIAAVRAKFGLAGR